MVSPSHKKRAVQHVAQQGLCSTRRACGLVDLASSSYYHSLKGPTNRRQEGLGVRPVSKQKRRTRPSMGYPVQAAYPGHVWSWDFIMDRTTDGRPVKMLTMVDEYTRQCLVIHPARSITSDQVLNTLQRLADIGGGPAFIRSDNGSEFIAHIIQDWCHIAEVQKSQES